MKHTRRHWELIVIDNGFTIPVVSGPDFSISGLNRRSARRNLGFERLRTHYKVDDRSKTRGPRIPGPVSARSKSYLVGLTGNLSSHLPR
jgi:hypothetical protein